MAASDHLNETLFHGTITKHGVLNPGDVVVPRSSREDIKEKRGSLRHDIATHVFATTNFDDAKEYGRSKQDDTPYNAVVYEVDPSGDMFEDDFHGEGWDGHSYASPTGFRVKRVVWGGE